jgi:uncharacterized protein (TIGR02001 family)
MSAQARLALALVCLFACRGAAAQLGASLTLESDYRFRGVSLSGGKPDAHLALAWDHPGGAYAGASATAVELEPGQRRAARMGYRGYARRADPLGLGWEAGVSAAHFVAATGYDYAELYAGVIGERWNARLAFSPDYFNQGARTLYAELNGGRNLARPWRVFGHVGALDALDARALPSGASRLRFDVRLGVAATQDDWEVQLAYAATGRGGLYPATYEDRRRRGWVLSAAYFF